MMKSSGRRRHSGAEQMQQPNQWTSLTVDQGEDSKTSKKEEEMRQDASEFVTGTEISKFIHKVQLHFDILASLQIFFSSIL